MPRRALVLLHGFTGSPECWRRVLAGLEPGRPRFVPCLLGHDGTSGEAGAPSFEAELERLAAELQAHRYEGAHLVGYSLGARVALGLLIRHPELFTRATLLGVHPGLDSARERAERCALDQRWRELLLESPIEVFCEKWEKQPIFGSQARLAPEVLAEQRRVRLGQHPLGLARALQVLGLGAMPCYREDLRTLELPVELVVGELDPKFLALAQSMAERLPRARVLTVPAVGHNVVLEHPDVVARLVHRFV